jgi:hypothetical protein
MKTEKQKRSRDIVGDRLDVQYFWNFDNKISFFYHLEWIGRKP